MTGLRRRSCLGAAGLALALAAGGVRAQPAAPGRSAPVSRWEDLVPKDWDPAKQFRQTDLSRLSDSDPRAQQLLRELREVWDNAPANPRLEGAAVRLPGYAVPLDGVQGELREFLLVPYFGACIHSPPPPANQIVHVLLDKPFKGFRLSDAVWVSGTLRITRQDTAMGVSGYALRGASVERYVPPARP